MRKDVSGQPSEVSERGTSWLVCEDGVEYRIRSAKDLIVYRRAYSLAMEVFKLSKGFPPEERYALTTQCRRSSRSVCLNFREAWAKRRYRAHFVSKLSDCDAENSETDSALDFALDCGYIDNDPHSELSGLCSEIGRMLGSMMTHPDKFLIHDPSSDP